MVYHYKDGEEKSEGSDAQCKGKTRFIIKQQQTQDTKTQRENKLEGHPSGRLHPLVGYTLWQATPLAGYTPW